MRRIGVTEEGEVLVAMAPETWQGLRTGGVGRTWKDTVLDWLRKGHSIALAADLSGVSRATVHRHRKIDPAFGDAVAAILAARKTSS